MIINVANPIYDAIFKFLMEDERVAKTILSALLKREVAEVESRKHEYANGTRDKISMFRIDFAAKVRQDDGSLKLVLIELQKTWVETETLRFRQYLGAQYSDQANVIKRDDELQGHGIPMIAVYLLGHRVGDIEEPIIYVSHKSYDYNGVEITKGMPDPFVESLVHDSIIVQIPLLHGRINNRLAKVLSVFDQSNIDGSNSHMLSLNDEDYADEDMKHILHRLTLAATDAKLRQDMNVEDEYFSAIENRDTMIMQRDKKIERQTEQLAQKDAQIEKQSVQLEEKNAQLEQKDAQLAIQQNAILLSAKTMRDNGVPYEQITTATGLTAEEIQNL